MSKWERNTTNKPTFEYTKNNYSNNGSILVLLFLLEHRILKLIPRLDFLGIFVTNIVLCSNVLFHCWFIALLRIFSFFFTRCVQNRNADIHIKWKINVIDNGMMLDNWTKKQNTLKILHCAGPKSVIVYIWYWFSPFFYNSWLCT